MEQLKSNLKNCKLISLDTITETSLIKDGRAAVSMTC